jgi:membrane fusion protein (multidrug efflux system)
LIVRRLNIFIATVLRSLLPWRRYSLIGFGILLPLLVGAPAALAQTPARPPVDVTVVEVKPQDTPAAFEYTGKTESSREVEIRARITGYLDEIAYQEGSLVKQGQLLFQIDPRPFKAELDNAKGALAQEQAKLDNARANLARIKPLAKENAVSQKDLDDATATVLATQAGVQSAKAQVQQAEINLGYTTIRSPLNGLASRSEKKVGSLISPGDSLLTTVVRLNPIWVNFAVGENELLKYREQTAAGTLRSPGVEGIQVELVLADGSVYPQKGRIDYVAPSVDRQTGTLAMRAVVPNPKEALKPGQFMRVRIQGVTRPHVIMAPQRAVMQGPQGKFVFVVGPDNTAESRSIEVGDWYGDQWIVTKGLQAGDKVIVDGAVKLQPGAPIKILETPSSGPTAKP